MKNIQYHHWMHQKSNRHTIAVNVDFSKDDLLYCLTSPNHFIDIEVGISFVHPKDRYNKKIGRELSAQRLTKEKFKLKVVRVDKRLNDSEEYLSFMLQSENYHLTFKVSHKSNKPHLIVAN